MGNNMEIKIMEFLVKITMFTLQIYSIFVESETMFHKNPKSPRKTLPNIN